MAKTKNSAVAEISSIILKGYGALDNAIPENKAKIEEFIADKNIAQVITRTVMIMAGKSMYFNDILDNVDSDVAPSIINVNMFYDIKRSEIIEAVQKWVATHINDLNVVVNPDITDDPKDQDLLTIHILSGIVNMMVRYINETTLDRYCNTGEILMNILDDISPDLLDNIINVIKKIIKENKEFVRYNKPTFVTSVVCRFLGELRFKSFGNITLSEDDSEIKEMIQFIIDTNEEVLV